MGDTQPLFFISSFPPLISSLSICYPIFCWFFIPLSIYIPKWPAQSHGLTSARMLGEFFLLSLTSLPAVHLPSYRQKSATRVRFLGDIRSWTSSLLPCCFGILVEFSLSLFSSCCVDSISRQISSSSAPLLNYHHSVHSIAHHG